MLNSESDGLSRKKLGSIGKGVQIAEFVINDGAISVMDLNEIDTDLWRRGVISFTIPVLAEEILAMSRILLKAA